MTTVTDLGVGSSYLADDVLLSTEMARDLYHGVAETCPIVDVHTHLPALDIASDRRWANLADLWLADDHYKWRAMRQAGVAEELITGGADPWERFQAWAATVPRLVRNPLYVWTHLELRRVFGIDLVLSPATAQEIWEEANRQLPSWSAQRLLAHFRVAAVATTDDPGDDLGHHVALRASPTTSPLAMVPTMRPDAAHRLLGDPLIWHAWVERLGAANGVRVTDLDSMLEAISVAWRRTTDAGGRASDHGLAHLPDRAPDPAAADHAVRTALAGGLATPDEGDAVLLEVVALAARLAHADDAVLQLHLGPRRDASPRLLARRSGLMPAATPSVTTGKAPVWFASSAISRGPERCPEPCSTTPTRPTTPSLPPSPAPSAGPGAPAWCSGGRRGGSTTTREACVDTSTISRRSERWACSSAC